MGTALLPLLFRQRANDTQSRRRAVERGQAAVEFTLVFIIFMVIAFIPADFGLAFYTGQLALNASREGARIAAADTSPTAASCTMPCSSATNSVLVATSKRMSSALLPGATVSVAVNGTCPLRMVTVSVSGNYNYFYYKVFRLFGGSTPDAVNIARSTTMRWEHQACN